MGTGNWGIASNGSLGEEGNWKSGLTYQAGDIVTLKGEDGVISYAVNDKWADYTYTMKTSELYLSASLYYNNNQIELIDY